MNKIICIHDNVTIDIDYHIEKSGSSHPLSEDPPFENIEIDKIDIYVEIDEMKIYTFTDEQSENYFKKYENRILRELE